MVARVPLDVDLEDKVLYGLTPMRLAYVLVALVAAFALWSPHWAPLPVRAIAALVAITLGAASGWGRWRGRPADTWAVDVVIFAASNYRIDLDERWLFWRRRSPLGGKPLPPTAAEDLIAEMA